MAENERVNYVVIDNKTFRDEVLTLDNCKYVNCRFEAVTFLYSGGPWLIENCHMKPVCEVVCQGSAYWTMRLIQNLRELQLKPVLFPPDPRPN